MKKVIVLSLSAALLFSACSNSANRNSASGGGHDHSSHEHTSAGATAQPLNFKDDKLAAVHQHYIHLTTALTNSDAAEAKVAAAAIQVGAKEITGATKIEKSAAKIAAASGLEEQRAEYSALSGEFISLVKTSGLKSGEMYVDYCPMASDNNGAYWVSNTKEIKNPYFGESMLTCGEVKETIK